MVTIFPSKGCWSEERYNIMRTDGTLNWDRRGIHQGIYLFTSFLLPLTLLDAIT